MTLLTYNANLIMIAPALYLAATAQGQRSLIYDFFWTHLSVVVDRRLTTIHQIDDRNFLLDR